MLTELIAFLARPEDYRAIWRDGELTIEALADVERQEACSEPKTDIDDVWKRPARDARDGLTAVA
jgi:hypothetical protein